MPAFWMIVSCFPVRLHGRVREARLGAFSTGEIVFWRGLVSMLMMVGLAASRGIGLKTPHWKMHLSRSVSDSIALGCYFFAIGLLPLATVVTSQLHLAALRRPGAGRCSSASACAPSPCSRSRRLRRRGIAAAPRCSPAMAGALAGLGSGALASLAYVSLRASSAVPASRKFARCSGSR